MRKGNIYAPVMDDDGNVIGHRRIGAYASDSLYGEDFAREMSKRAEPLHTVVTVGAVASTLVIAAPIAGLEIGASGLTTIGVAGVKATQIAVKRLRNLAGMSRTLARSELEKLGFKRKPNTAGGYERWRHADGSEVQIRPDGEVVQTAPRQWKSDDSLTALTKQNIFITEQRKVLRKLLSGYVQCR
jgi:hypothetical protein